MVLMRELHVSYRELQSIPAGQVHMWVEFLHLEGKYRDFNSK